MNRKSFLRILTLLLFLTGIIFTLGMKSAPVLSVSEADTRIDLKTFFVKRGVAEVDGSNPTESGFESHAACSIAWSDAWRGLNSDDFGVEAYAPYLFTSNQAWASEDTWQYGTFEARSDGMLEFAIANDITEDYSKYGMLTISLLPKQEYAGEFSAGVRNEKIATNTVPEPATIILLGCGL
ncbi:MAG: hypothetical protein EHM49_01470, partial [Deltaproteobacteria bacterium]